jgi:hypothetical protein
MANEGVDHLSAVDPASTNAGNGEAAKNHQPAGRGLRDGQHY